MLLSSIFFIAASVVNGYLIMLNASMRFLVGTAFRGYFGLRGNLRVFGRRKRTDVRTLRRRVPKGPFAAFRRARLAFKIAAAFARADPFCNFAVAAVVFLTTGFLAGAFPAIFLTGAFLTGLPSLPFAAGLVAFLAAGFLSVAFFAGAAFLSAGFFAAGFFSAGLAAAGFFSAGFAFFSAGFAAAGAAAGFFSAVFFAGSAFLG